MVAPKPSTPVSGSPSGSPPSFPLDRFAAFVVSRTEEGVDARVETLTDGDLPEGEVTVRVDWSAINYKDAMVTRPGNRVARISPLVPGVDLAGTVIESTDPDVPIGEEVVVHGYDLGVSRHGGFAEVARVPAGWVVPLPEGLSLRQAATIGTAGFTAALSLERLEHNGLEPAAGPVLVTGASGGVGSMAVALLAARGYDVVASTGKTAEHGYLRGLGASRVIGRDDLDEAPERTLGPERWAGAVDCVGGATLRSVLRTLRYGASVAASGLTGGATFESSVHPFVVRNVSLLGIDTVMTPIARRRRIWQVLAGAYPGPLIEQMVAGEVGLEELGDALGRIMAGGVRGRILVDPARGHDASRRRA